MTGPDMHVSGADKTPLVQGLDAVVDRLDALVGLQRNLQQDLKANLDIAKNFGTAQQAKAARDVTQSLHGGGDPLAGQIKTDPEQVNGPGARPVNPAVPPDAVSPAPVSPATFGGRARRAMTDAWSNLASSAGISQLPVPGQHGVSPGIGVPSLNSVLGQGRHAAPGGGNTVRNMINPTTIRAAGAAATAIGEAGLAGGASGALAAMGPAAPFAAGALEAYRAGHEVYKIVKNQRDAGYRYQEIEGGSNLRAQRERFHESMYARFTPGWSDGEARQAFMDVTAMGLNRRDQEGGRLGRQEALNTMYHAKTTLGMTEAESAPFIQQAANTTSANMTALAVALREVSNAAGEAGVNAKMLRQHLQESIGSGIQGGMGYTGAVQNAQASQVYATWGRQYANISTDAQNDRGMRYRYAATAGMTPGQYLNMTRDDPAGAAAIREKVTQRSLDSMLTPEMRSWIKNAVAQEQQAHGDVSESAFDQIGDDFRRGPGANLNPDVMVDVLQNQAGVTGVNLENWAGFVVRSVVGRTKGAEAAREFGSTAMVGADGKYVSGALKGQTAEGKNHQGAKLATSSQGDLHNMTHGSILGRAGAVARGVLDFDTFNKKGIFGNDNKGKDAYSAWSKRNGGISDPVIESLLNVKGMDPDKQKVSVVVKGKDGKDERRYMTMTEAIRDYHNEVVSGDMHFEDGTNKGKSYQAVGAMGPDASRDTSKERGDTKKAGKYETAKQFKHDEDYGTDHGIHWNPWNGKKGLWAKTKHGLSDVFGHDNKSDMGKNKLDLTDDAKKLLKLLPGDTGAAAAAGVPPDPSGAVTNR